MKPGAGLLICAAWALAPLSAMAQGCVAENHQVTLSGVMGLAKGTSVHTGKRYAYSVLKLDRPLCYRDETMGEVPQGRLVAVIPNAARGGLGDPRRLTGKRLTLTGVIAHSITADQPPQALLLLQPTRAARSR